MKGLLEILLSFLLPACILGADYVLLDGDWKVSNANQSILIAGHVPGSIYTDLMGAGILGDPYYRFNDQEYRWVAYDNWTYSRTFEVDEALMAASHVQLVAEGLDTVASITINNQAVASVNNMFRQWTFDVKEQLEEGTNLIVIDFMSPVHYAVAQANASAYPVPPVNRNGEHGEPHRNFIRKMQAAFSWDWGPAFPTMGIWKSIYIQACESTPITHIMITTIQNEVSTSTSSWSLNYTVCFDVQETSRVQGHLGVKVTDVLSYEINIHLPVGQECYQTVIETNGTVVLWWPNGMGVQKLYDVMTTFSDSNSGEIYTDDRKIGFRTVELIQESIEGSEGLSFYFNVNGIPTFMKGTNWIPADVLQERLTKEYIRRLLTSAVEVNMNMIRVWGGGVSVNNGNRFPDIGDKVNVYESDTFYELADELGLLIWQDCMFACSMYPATDDFLSNVRHEITHQVRRIMYHTSIVMWAANNENELALVDDWYDTGNNHSLYLSDYLKLYIGTVYDILVKEDPSRPFVPSSSSNGEESKKEGWVAKDPGSKYYGDVHFYDYSSDLWDWKIYPNARFASEYGIQSWCTFENVKKVSIKEDWDISGNFSNSRQHHPNGNGEMKGQIAMNLNLPATNDTAEYFKHFIYLSQINQAMGIKTETEHYRRLQGNLIKGAGHTMGALFWQINDIWQAPTWASIEYGGKWKMLHYYAKRFFSDNLISPYQNGSDLMVYYIQNPSLQMSNHGNENPVVQPNLVIMCHIWDNFMALNTLFIPLNSTTKASTLVFQHDLEDLLETACYCKTSNCFLTMYIDVAPETKNWFFPIPFKNVTTMQKAEIKVTNVMQLSAKEFQIKLETNWIAPFIWLEAPGISGRFSDNGFLMIAPQAAVSFFPWNSGITSSQLQQVITTKSLMDAYTV